MWARASTLHRHLECPAAAWYPRDEHGKWEYGYLANQAEQVLPSDIENAEDSIFAEWGTQMHLAKEKSPFAQEPFLGKVEPHRERLWPESLGRHEIPVSYNCRTGMVLEGPKLNGDAWKKLRGPDEITGTVDWIGHIPTGDIWVDDLKTGYQAPDPLSVQLKFYSLCFSKLKAQALTPTKTVRTSATHWRRDWDEPIRYWKQVTWLDLEEFEEEIKRAWRETLRLPEPRPGTHCLYCPSVNVCEAVNGVII